MSIRARILLICGLILALASLTTYLIYARALDQAATEGLLAQSRAFFQQIVITRRWVALHGGVFVRKDPGIETNQYLLEIPGLVVDIQDTNGQTYTLRNPALVTRELSALAESQGNFYFHITSLELVNPNNAPDDFETQALQKFEQGKSETWQFEETGDERIFRYMAPLYVEKSCLRCHGWQGYEVGDVRGGISVSVMESKDSPLDSSLIIGWFLGGIITLGVLYWSLNAIIITPIQKLKAAADAISYGSYNQPILVKRSDEIGELANSFEDMREQVQEYTLSLEDKVQQRTLELQNHTDHLEELVADRTQELREAQEKLFRQEKLAVLGQLAGNVGHELRNPLGVITNAVHFLNMELSDVDSRTKEYLEMIGFEAKNAAKIVTDLLDFASIKASDRQSIPVDKIITESVEKTSISDGITFNAQIPGDLAPVWVDPLHITHVMNNM